MPGIIQFHKSITIALVAKIPMISNGKKKQYLFLQKLLFDVFIFSILEYLNFNNLEECFLCFQLTIAYSVFKSPLGDLGGYC